MKIRIYSDLHIEFGRSDPMFDRRGGEELVVLAGDIDLGVAGINWAREKFPHVPVVYVLGNHEYYGFDFDQMLKEIRAFAHGTNVHVLEEDHFDIGGIRVLGTTLWTDFEAYGAEHKDMAMQWAIESMNDFRAIKDSGHVLTPQRTVQAFQRSVAWLTRQIDEADRPLVVVTHHAPTMATISPRYEGMISNAAYHSNLDRLLRAPVLMWVHGHTHYCANRNINGVRVVSNQWGYPKENVVGFRKDGLFHLAISNSAAIFSSTNEHTRASGGDMHGGTRV
ncbi:MAG: metallophosphoesterase [Pseudomonadota bacterium]|nr:metallophosphoesterase [Pseudomonadota bacterium]